MQQAQMMMYAQQQQQQQQMAAAAASSYMYPHYPYQGSPQVAHKAAMPDGSLPQGSGAGEAVPDSPSAGVHPGGAGMDVAMMAQMQGFYGYLPYAYANL
eukprot:CAMPEP_0172028920 /NCGR_PEP_ID=MMETSP1041-20130122/17845_1 /TAXON_ID=464988 /ORGANISM="Hemiselmis andersenii, Strain CCMP439" /LENGTH=98 /DNA_ID=CAMNT_0012685029 /DNA_START=1 /DNA_END=294 /DNA_ORIENTATION=+